MILLIVVSLTMSAIGRPAIAANWLDQPLANWNTPGRALPRAAVGKEPREALLKRCGLTLRETTANERSLAAAGWIPYLPFDRQILKDDVEVVFGMSGANAQCQPVGFNGFAFVAGRFAGTLSPELMTTGHDGAAGPTRLVPPDLVTVDVARYRPSDSECCPSAHVTVRYRIDRSGPQPLLMPVEIRQTRG